MEIECRECRAIHAQAEEFLMAGRCFEHGVITVFSFTPKADEFMAIQALAKELELSETQVIRQAIRLYQLEHEKKMGRYVELPAGCGGKD